MEEYDPTTDTWTKKANMPTARSGLSTSVVDGKIYAIGGWKPDLDLSIVEEYDPATDTWKKKARMPTARSSLAASVVNSKIYAIGGSSVTTVEEYEPSTDTWTTKADMPIGRFALSTSVVDGKIYAIGGSPDFNVAIPTVEEYTPEGWPFQKAISPHGNVATTWAKIKSD